MTNIDTLLVDINLFYKELDPATMIPWDFTTTEGKEIDFESFLRILQIIKKELNENKSTDLNKLYNKEIFLRAAEFFEKYIEKFNLQNYVF